MVAGGIITKDFQFVSENDHRKLYDAKDAYVSEWLSAPRYGRTQIGATYYGVLRRELPAIRQISTSV